MRADTFLSMYRVLEGMLGEKYSDANPKTSSVVMMYIQDDESEPVRQKLDVCREVRNLLTHNASPDGTAIIEPSQALLDSLYEIISYVEKPQSVLNYATKAENILQAHPNERMLDVMRRMFKNGFSHVPVIDDGRFTGVFSKSSVFRYLIENGSIGNDTRINELKESIKITGQRGCRYVFLPPTATYLEARAKFENMSGRNNRLAAIFITETGDENGALLGMITPWDVMKDTPASRQ